MPDTQTLSTTDLSEDAIDAPTLHDNLRHLIVIDVRKDAAVIRSGNRVHGALRGRPFCADLWWREFIGQEVVVYCVHGHEVSRAVCGMLRDHGIAARYLINGFEGWLELGYPVEAINADWAGSRPQAAGDA